jgi:hypothetical protein
MSWEKISSNCYKNALQIDIRLAIVGFSLTEVAAMTHAKSLRVIGQCLEVARLAEFEVETDGENYIVKSDFLTKTGEWILRHALRPNDLSEESAPQSTVNRLVRFTPVDISRLDEQAQRQRRTSTSPDTQAYRKLSQLLRTLGAHLDRTAANSFRISWTSALISVDFEAAHGESDSRTFTTDKLGQLGAHSRFRRSSLTRSDSNLPNFQKQSRPQR